MAFLLELKENIKRIYNRYDVYIVPALRFLVALVSICLLNLSIGYMSTIKNPVIVFLASVVCAFLPGGFTLIVLSAYMLLHLYSISVEFAIVAVCIVFLMYLMYFRLSPKKSYLLILTVILCAMKLPYVVPVAMGLSVGLSSIVPVSFGVVIYYIINTAAAYEAAISSGSSVDAVLQISFIAETFVGNRSWLVLVLAFAVTIVVVYCIKRLSIDNAWTYAIFAGTAVQFVLLIVGVLAFNAKLSLVFMIIGTILGAAVGYVCQIVFFSVDYKRTEYVQYEDDEYYYYVKAVPKINVVNADIKVKKINGRNTKRTSSVSNVRGSSRDADDIIEIEDDYNY